jgi:DNA-binding CsgD family transcriptional regulator
MLIGRSAETAAIDRLVAEARAGRSGVLVIRGEAGVGKSALLEQARAAADGLTVLQGVGVEFESELAYAALHQILRPAFDRITRLPEPQAMALRAAFALSDETVGERFRVSLGVLGLLSELAEEQPVLCLIDDAQWLDEASADALVFAARRLVAEPLVLLFAARDGTERVFAAPGLPELRLKPLDPPEARTLVAARAGMPLAPEVVDWVVDSADGNPLALVELPESLSAGQLSGREPLTGALLPTTSVEQTYLARVARLAQPTQALLLVAAAEDTGDRATIASAAVELGLEIAALAPAEEAGLVRVGAERVEFRHPLVRSAVYRGATFTARERTHRVLAAVLTDGADADRRAWHRAAATVGTDDEVADELERSADRAAARSGNAAAAAALERAADLSVDETSQARRLVAAGTAAWRAGRPERATTLLDRAAPVVSDPRLQAELDHVRGVIQLRCGVLLDACTTLMDGAARVAPYDPRKALEMLFDGGEAAGNAGDFTRMAQLGQRVAALPRSDDEGDAFVADLLVGVGSLWEGKTADEAPLVRDVIARAAEFHEPRWLVWAAVGAASAGDEAREAELLRRAATLARASGAVDTLTLVLVAVSLAGFLATRVGVIPEATEGLRLAKDGGLGNSASVYIAVLAWFAAVRGQEGECRTYVAEATEHAQATGMALANAIAEWALALLDLSGGRPDETIKRLEALRSAPPGSGTPYIALTSTPDLVEAYVRTGQRERGHAAFAILEGFARPGAPIWGLSLAARCRALLAENGEAQPEFAEALRLHSQSHRVFDRARTELLLGEHLRRERRRLEARDHLRAAADGFEALGAEPWAERARSELRATGETVRKRDPSTVDELTPQELQIARLVAEGGSNKEIAGQLFLSPRTVEYHLRKVFAKLGITSRAELIRREASTAAVPETAAVGL